MRRCGWMAAAPLVLALVIGGCSQSGRPDAPASPEPGGTSNPLPAVLTLPPPSALNQLLPAPRRSSYLPSDLVKGGEAYASAYAHQRVVATAGGGVFSPAFPEENSPFSGLSFAIYSFLLPGYEGPAAVTCTWNNPPADPADVHVGLAKWDEDAWEFHPGSAISTVLFPTIEDYVGSSGRILVSVVVTGTDSCELDRVRIGSLPPVASITVSEPYGLTPVTVNFDASVSNDPDGTVAEYRWDPEGDGTFQESTGTASLLEWEYTTGGDFRPTVRVVDNSGVYAEAWTDFMAAEEGLFSFGRAGIQEVPGGIAVTPTGELLCFMNDEFHASPEDVVVSRMTPLGDVEFVRNWSGASGSGVVHDAICGPDSYVYTCGEATSTAHNSTDALIQKWTPSGELLWSRTIGNPGFTEAFYAVMVVGDSIYACGSLKVPSTPGYAIVARFNTSGDKAWLYSLVGPAGAVFVDIEYVVNPLGPPQVCVCGTYWVTDTDSEALYAAYDPDGNRLTCLRWGNSADDESASGLDASQAEIPTIWVGGSVNASGGLELSWVGRPGAGAATAWAGVGNYLETTDVLCPDNDTVNLLVARRTGASLSFPSSTVLTTFDQSLFLVAQREMGALPDGNLTPLQMRRYGTGLLVAGMLEGERPFASDITLTHSFPSTLWDPEVPPQGTPSGLVVADTPLTLTDLSGYEVDVLGQADAYVYLTR